MAEVDESRPPSGDIASWVKKRWLRADNALAMQRRDYWLNLSFIEGDQWVYWHKGSSTVSEFPRERDSDRVRLTVNRMQPNLVNLLAKLTKRNLAFEVSANGADDASLGGARLAEHLLETERNDRLWEQVRRDEVHACFLGGTAGVMVEWDPNAGEELYADPETEEAINEGNVVLSALSVTEFTLEPGTRHWMDSRWLIACRAMPSAQVKDHYKLDFTPTADVQALAGPMQRRITGGFGSLVDLTNVYTYYERPTNSGKGRWAVVVNDRTVLDKPWPFPFDTLNLYPFRQVPLPKQWTGHTFLNDARSLQVAYNHACSMLSEHMKLAGNARLALPDNSGIEATDLSDLPGEIITYDGMSGGQGPHWLEPPNLPRWLQDHTLRLESKLDDIMGVHNISRGVAPGDRNSGLALSVLAEQDESPTGLMAHDQADGWGYIGTLVLKLWEENVAEYRTATVASDSGVPAQRKWTGKMLNGQTRATVPLDNVQPHSKVATQAWVTQFAPQFPQLFAGFNSSQLARLLDLPSPAMFAETMDADAAQAQRENMLMADGLIPALDDKPFPQPFDNHAVHIAEHNRFRKALAVSAKVLTPTGWRRMGDLAVGDQVIGSDGSPTRVENVIDHGEQTTYRLDFTGSASVLADGDHIWTCRGPNERWGYKRNNGRQAGYENPQLGAWKERRTSEILDQWGETPKAHHRIEVPMMEPLQLPLADLPLDPYTLGVLLGDAYIRPSGDVILTSADEEIVKALDAPRITKGQRYTWNISGLRPVMRDLNLAGHRAWEKFVPSEYLLSSEDQRLALLQGLMDTDGCATLKGHASFCTVSEQLAEDVRFLVGSLGGSTTTYTKQNERVAYELSVRLPVNPFWLGRKVERFRPVQPKRLLRSIREEGREPTRCITVEAADGLFVTENFIVTHNSREYYYAQSNVRNIVDMHIKAHENLALEEAAGQRAMNQVLPGSAAFPQAHEPPGSMVPPDLAEQPPPPPPGAGGQSQPPPLPLAGAST